MIDVDTFRPVDAGAGEVKATVHLALVLCEHIVADRACPFEISAPTEVAGAISAAAALVDSRLWIRTQRPAAGRDTLARVSRQNSLGRLALLYQARSPLHSGLFRFF